MQAKQGSPERMDVTLAAVTIISLLLAWAMAVVSWQRVRAERRRGDARVAALLEELAGGPRRTTRPICRRPGCRRSRRATST